MKPRWSVVLEKLLFVFTTLPSIGRQSRSKGWGAPLLVVPLLCILSVLPAVAQPLMVTVSIDGVGWNGCDDGLNPPDIYFIVGIDGDVLSNSGTPLESNFNPLTNLDLEFSTEVDFSTEFVDIVIEQWDKDAVGDDDRCDLGVPGADMNLTLDLQECEITGEMAGVCGEPFLISTSDAYFAFQIDVEEPPRAPGLNVRCIHDPIWPQSGDIVTFTAEALDGNADLITSQPVDNIEIWVEDDTAPIATSATTPGSVGSAAFAFNYTLAPGTSGEELIYRCRVSDAGETVSTGWRIAQIGEPAFGRAVPLVFTGTRSSAIDIVFIADRDNYTGADDPAFLVDVKSVIRDAYYAGDNGIRNAGRLFLGHQHQTNFWLALDQGDAYRTTSDKCMLETPENWDSAYAFADSGAIVHSNAFRDCAYPARRVFSSEPTSLDTFLHEAGHSPFGLTDEYCCNTHYFQASTLPNVYASQIACLDDDLAVGVGDACQQLANSSGATVDWFRLDSFSTIADDLMVDSGDHSARAADQRRIDWLYETCQSAGCF